MEFLSDFLPILVYILLIGLIIVGIILGIKIIITIDKVTKIVDDVSEKVEKVTPLFNTFGLISNKFSGIVTTVIGTVENLIFKIINNKRKEEKEEDE